MFLFRQGATGLQRFWRRDDGATAIEFAFVAAPFFLLAMALLEIGVMMFVESALDNATKSAARQLRTGNVQAATDPLTTFRDLFCTATMGTVDCAQVYSDVRTFTSYEDVSLPPPTFDSTGAPTNFTFQPGGAREIVVVRMLYRWDFITPLLSATWGSERIIVSSAILKTEPF